MFIRLHHKGNPGNIIMTYLAAIKMQQELGYGYICNVDIPIFNINIDDINTEGQLAVHDREKTNSLLLGRIPTKGYSRALNSAEAKYFFLEGFYQNINNFPSQSSFNYDKHFPLIENSNECGGEEDIVISIRGGDILKAIHPHYTMLPPEFYEFLIKKTGKRPIFYGQLDDSPYLDELRQRFPTAKFIASRGVAEDFDFLRKSQYIVPSLSTFSWLAAWLSKAKKIYMPVAGIFSPAQHPSSMLLPINDDRYEFYTFPVYYALNIENYRSYLDPVRNRWERTTPRRLYKASEQTYDLFNASLEALNFNDYLKFNPELHEDNDKFGNIGLLNNFTSHGFWSNYKYIDLDEGFYSRSYPDAALDVSLGRYSSLLEHYLLVGYRMGYQRKA